MKHTAFVLMGGNVGDVPASFSTALAKFRSGGLTPVRMSSLYISEPWGMDGAAPFHNQAVMLHTEWSARQLLTFLLSTEHAMGRTRQPGLTQSRRIDLDILFYDDLVVSEPKLTIPHPRMHLRRFALLPMKEIAPDHIHPLLDKSIRQLLEECPDQLMVKKLRPEPAQGNEEP